MRRFVVAAAALLAAGVHADAAAQAPAYARAPGDTLRYAERAEAYTRSSGADGVIKFTHESRVAIAFAPGDTARAWFEWLRVAESGPDGEESAGAEGEGLPFVLRFGPRGVDGTLSAPDFPESLDRVSDLRMQFVNFLPRLPGRPLAPGVAWADTLVVEDPSEAWKGRHVRIISYRVAGDSAIGAVPVVVVEFTARVDSRGRGGLHVAYDEVTEREERGRFYFAPGPGVLVRRVRSGVETQVLTAVGDPDIRVDQQTAYDSRIDLIGGPRE